jgi:peptide/nickel transport system substrate-binding protein
MSTRSGLFIAAASGSAAALVLTACVPGEDPDAEDADAPGFEACEDDPLECNTGEREDGGEIVWLINSPFGGWSAFTPEGGSVYQVQAVAGVLPYTGRWEPDAETYDYNMDLLAAEPEILNDGSDGEPYQFQFEFSPDAQWDDGMPIDAHDMRMSWMFAKGEEGGDCNECISRSPTDYLRIDSVDVEDDGATAVVTMVDERPWAEWFGLFSAHGISSGMYPAHIGVEEGFLDGTPEEPDLEDPDATGEYYNWLNETMPEFSGGPYRLVEGDLDNQVIKEPNDNYYGEDAATLETIVMQINEEEPSWAPAVANGELHGGNPAQYNEDVITELEELDNVHMDVQPGSSWEHLDINLQNEPLDDLDLRMAIFTAIDVDEILERNFAAGYPEIERQLNHSFPPDSPYYQDNLSDSIQGTGDVEEARSILEDAGYEWDGDTLMLDGEQVGPFTLRATDVDIRQTSLQIVQGHLDDIGIETELEPIDDLGGVLAEADYDIIQYGWSGNPFIQAAPSQQWHSASSSNWGGLENDEVDALLDAQEAAEDLDEAGELINQAQQLVIEEAYVLPLSWEPNANFVVDDYVNIRPQMHDSHRSTYNIGEWGVQAQ